MKLKKAINLISILGLLLSLAYLFYLYKNGILTDKTKLDEYINGLGTGGLLIFILIQIIQVVIPIIPGGISCVAGVTLFGIIKGLILNYIGICIGSIIVFFISRKWGRPVIENLFDEKKIQKFDSWLQKGNKLTVIFAMLILSPVTPDDFLCYCAGTTNMKFKHFATIILLGKPLPITVYSLGLNAIIQGVLQYA